jgi:molybdenum cofactor synthesis domain-containing protein
MRAKVIVASNRASAGVYEDRGGPILVEGLRELGFEVGDPHVVPDGEPVHEALTVALAEDPDVILTSGGTGLTAGDLTPEMTRRVLDREVPGVAEAIRAYGLAKGVPAAMLSRGLAGMSGRTLVVNLPGTRGGCRDGLAVLRPVLQHAIDQIAGIDHSASGHGQVESGAHVGAAGDASAERGEHLGTPRPDAPAVDTD